MSSRSKSRSKRSKTRRTKAKSQCNKPFHENGTGGPSRFQLMEALKTVNAPILQKNPTKKQLCDAVIRHGVIVPPVSYSLSSLKCGANYDYALGNPRLGEIVKQVKDYNKVNPVNPILGVEYKNKIELCHDLMNRGQPVNMASAMPSMVPSMVPSASRKATPQDKLCAQRYSAGLNYRKTDLLAKIEQYNKTVLPVQHINLSKAYAMKKEQVCKMMSERGIINLPPSIPVTTAVAQAQADVAAVIQKQADLLHAAADAAIQAAQKAIQSDSPVAVDLVKQATDKVADAKAADDQAVAANQNVAAVLEQPPAYADVAHDFDQKHEEETVEQQRDALVTNIKNRKKDLKEAEDLHQFDLVLGNSVQSGKMVDKAREDLIQAQQAVGYFDGMHQLGKRHARKRQSPKRQSPKRHSHKRHSHKRHSHKRHSHKRHSRK